MVWNKWYCKYSYTLNIRFKDQGNYLFNFQCNTLCQNQNYVPIKIHGSWSASMSLIGVSFVSFNGRMDKNLSLKNKTIDVLIQKWN